MSMQFITTWKSSLDEILSLARRFAHLEGTALLCSGGTQEIALTSFLCLLPDEKYTCQAAPGCWERLAEKINPQGEAPLPQWVGYLSYEMGGFADRDLQILPPHNLTGARPPDALFYHPTLVVQLEHKSQQATLYTSHPAHPSLESLLRTPIPSLTPPPSLTLSFASDTRASYSAKIGRIKEWIQQGEIYQLNLSQEWRFMPKQPLEETHMFSYFEKIHRLNPAPFSAYLQCGSFSLVSSSPELFLSKKGQRLETRPIKGTAPRGDCREQDERNRTHLMTSEKERAELLMITDLMRSDLGRIAQPGSVKTTQLWQCESYPNVFHLHSTIEAESRPGLAPLALLRALFPGGSITGCPKLRAQELIAEVEARPRGVYTGSIGYLASNGDFNFNIAIRTLVIHREEIQLQLGGAIVMDSDPAQEYEETLHKGQSLRKVLDGEEP